MRLTSCRHQREPQVIEMTFFGSTRSFTHTTHVPWIAERFAALKSVDVFAVAAICQ